MNMSLAKANCGVCFLEEHKCVSQSTQIGNLHSWHNTFGSWCPASLEHLISSGEHSTATVLSSNGILMVQSLSSWRKISLSWASMYLAMYVSVPSAFSISSAFSPYMSLPLKGLVHRIAPFLHASPHPFPLPQRRPFEEQLPMEYSGSNIFIRAQTKQIGALSVASSWSGDLPLWRRSNWRYALQPFNCRVRELHNHE